MGIRKALVISLLLFGLDVKSQKISDTVHFKYISSRLFDFEYDTALMREEDALSMFREENIMFNKDTIFTFETIDDKTAGGTTVNVLQEIPIDTLYHFIPYYYKPADKRYERRRNALGKIPNIKKPIFIDESDTSRLVGYMQLPDSLIIEQLAHINSENVLVNCVSKKERNYIIWYSVKNKTKKVLLANSWRGYYLMFFGDINRDGTPDLFLLGKYEPMYFLDVYLLKME